MRFSLVLTISLLVLIHPCVVSVEVSFGEVDGVELLVHLSDKAFNLLVGDDYSEPISNSENTSTIAMKDFQCHWSNSTTMVCYEPFNSSLSSFTATSMTDEMVISILMSRGVKSTTLPIDMIAEHLTAPTYANVKEKSPPCQTEVELRKKAIERLAHNRRSISLPNVLMRNHGASRKSPFWPRPFSEWIFWNTRLDEMDVIDLMSICNATLSSRYNKLEELGSGLGGDSHRAEDKETKQIVALKSYYHALDTIHTESAQVPPPLVDILTEIVIAQSLPHRHLRSLHSCEYGQMGVAAAYEYIDGTPLDKITVKMNRFMKNIQPFKGKVASWFGTRLRVVARLASDVIKALVVLHSHGIVHRDVKLDNALLNNKGYVQLIDYGLSAYTLGKRVQYASAGTAPYMAPEIFFRAHLASDIYSLGVMTLYLTGIPITVMDYQDGLDSEDDYSQFQTILAGNVYRVHDAFNNFTWPTTELGQQARSFVKSCIQMDPRERPSAEKILLHPFMRYSTMSDKTLIELLMKLGVPIEGKTVERKQERWFPF